MRVAALLVVLLGSMLAMSACIELLGGGPTVTSVPTVDTRPTEPPPTATAAVVPTTAAPTAAPTTAAPTSAPAAATTAPTTAPTAAPTKVASATPVASPTTDARAALGDVFAGWTGVKTFRARLTGSLAPAGGGTPTPQPAVDMEVVLPDRYHVRTGGASGQGLELIVVGGNTYVKPGPAPWVKAPGEPPLDMSTMDPKRMESEFRGNVSNVRLVGPETVDGTPTLVYDYVMSPTVAPTAAAGAPAKPSGPLNTRIWVGVADRLPRRIEVRSPTGESTSVTYSDYNAPITIEPPAT